MNSYLNAWKDLLKIFWEEGIMAIVSGFFTIVGFLIGAIVFNFVYLKTVIKLHLRKVRVKK